MNKEIPASLSVSVSRHPVVPVVGGCCDFQMSRLPHAVPLAVFTDFATGILVPFNFVTYLRGPTTPTIDQYQPFRGKFDSPWLKSRSLT